MNLINKNINMKQDSLYQTWDGKVDSPDRNVGMSCRQSAAAASNEKPAIVINTSQFTRALFGMLAKTDGARAVGEIAVIDARPGDDDILLTNVRATEQTPGSRRLRGAGRTRVSRENVARPLV